MESSNQAVTIAQAMKMALEHHEAGRLYDAEMIYRSILKTQPRHPDALHNLGVMSLQIGKPELGLANLKAALESNPAQAQYWLSYAEALLAAGQAQDAMSVLEQGMQRGLSGPLVDGLKTRISGFISPPSR